MTIKTNRKVAHYYGFWRRDFYEKIQEFKIKSEIKNVHSSRFFETIVIKYIKLGIIIKADAQWIGKGWLPLLPLPTTT